MKQREEIKVLDHQELSKEKLKGSSDFILNLERASNIVRSWPEWKQNAWGPRMDDIKDMVSNIK